MCGPGTAVLSFVAFLQGVLSTDSNWTVQMPRVLTAQKGLCVTIPCNYSYPNALGPTQLVAVWYKDYERPSQTTVYHTIRSNVDQDYKSRSQLVGNLTEMSCSLMINSIRSADNGTYHFRIELDKENYTDGNTYLDLKISDLEEKPNISYSPQIVSNKTTTLTCTFVDNCSGMGPNLTWINETILTNSATVTLTKRSNLTSVFSTSLTFVPSHRDMGKQLGCKAQYSVTNAESQQTLLLDVKYGPKIAKMSPILVTEGHSVQVNCSVTSNPLSNITWSTSNQNILASVLNKTLVLQFDNITRREQGLYHCRAWNDYGKAKRGINITVNYGPRIKAINGSAVALEGFTFQRDCLVDSWPPSSITWSKGDTVISNATSNQLTLSIHRVTDSDSGLYTCSALNSYGATNCSLYISVEYSPRNLSISSLDSRVINSSIETEEGMSVCLRCSVDSVPASNLTWRVNGIVRNQSIGSNELWLLFDNVTYKEDGKHQCVAENEHGTAPKSVTITLKYPPKETAVRVVGAEHGIKEGDNVTLSCFSKSNPPATNYSWFRIDGSNRTELNARTASVNLGLVTRELDAWFYCTAGNTMGSSNSIPFFVSVEYKPEISDVSECAWRDQGITCVCAARSNPPGNLTWHLPRGNFTGNQTHGHLATSRVSNGHLVTGTLTLRGREDEKEVKAICSVRNEHGEARFKVYLWVKGRGPYLSEMLIPVVVGAAGMLILSLIFCQIIVCCKRKVKSAANNSTEMQVLTAEPSPVLTASMPEENGELADGSGDEEGGEAGSLKQVENGEAGQVEEQEELELHYACIDFSKVRLTEGIVGTRDSTQYAEIKQE
ncbi:Schwann cell myelin protein-like [Heptranchias perlo]|uniref:Schwann cell myelin protein-like n=1 Tax=Heptranchias perlo TaxID=212740 RepID=UPI003559E287